MKTIFMRDGSVHIERDGVRVITLSKEEVDQIVDNVGSITPERIVSAVRTHARLKSMIAKMIIGV